MKYCPECGLEYEAGAATCTECSVALVDQPPTPGRDETEWNDLVAILVTADASVVMVAKSLLEAEGISCFAQCWLVQDLIGWGRLPSGVNLATGPIRLEVPRDHEDVARALLATHVELGTPGEGD